MSVIEKCRLTRIKPNPLNVRRDIGNVTELADSIRAQGLLEPLVVAPTGPEPAEGWGASKTAFLLIAGHRRLAAAKQAGLKDATVIVRPELTTEAAQLEAMLVENLQRVDITPVEEAAAYTQLLAFDGVTVADIAKRTGRAVATVKGRVGLARLPEAIKDSVHTGDVTLSDALAIAEFTDDPDAIKRLEAELGGYNFRHVLHRLRSEREAGREEKKTRAALKKAGVPIIDTPAKYPWGCAERPLHRLIGGFFLDETGAIEAHSTCPGHAAVIDRDGRAEYVCTDPEQHHPATDPDDEDDHGEGDASKASNDSYEFRRAARERGYDPDALSDQQQDEIATVVLEELRVTEVLATAQEVRASYVAELGHPDRKPPQDALALAFALTVVQDGLYDSRLAHLGLTLPDGLDLKDDRDARESWFIEQVLAASPDQLQRMALADLGYAWKSVHHWNDPSAQAWMTFLVRHGYPITPEETAKLIPSDPTDEQDSE